MRPLRRRSVVMSLGIASAFSAAVAILAFAAPPTGAILPDLVADAPQRMIVEPYTYGNGTQALLLRFDGYVHNSGLGPLEIRATGRSGASMTNTRQYVRMPDGTMAVSDPPPGPPVVQYETDDSHDHWHLMEIARYSLWNEAKTAEVSPAMKTGFCLVDSERVETTGPSRSVYTVSGNNFCGQGEPTRSSLTMGVSAGWRDLYHRNLSFQWVDVSDVRPGVYWVAAEIDTNGVIAESNESNNTRRFASTSSTVPGYVATAVTAPTVPYGGSGTVTLASTTFGSPGSRRFRIQTLPANGVLRSGTTTLTAGSVITGNTVTYVPNAGFSGADSFQYSAFDSTSPYPRTPVSAAASVNVGEQQQASVTISGAPQSLVTGASAQLTATVLNTGPGVTWTVNGVAGGDATVGTISPGGLYVAPASVPAGGSVTIRATSTATPTAFAEVAIAIQTSPDPDPAPNPGTNLVTNPSFETNTAGWVSWQGAISRVTLAGAPDGVAVARVARSTGTAFTIDDAPETVASTTAGTEYTAGAYVRAADPSSVGKTVRIRMRQWAPSGAERVRFNGPQVTLTNTFQPITVTGTATVSGDEIDVSITHEAAASGNAMYVDRISLTAGGAPPPPPPPANTPPSASFTVDPSNATVGQSVGFTDTSTDGDGLVSSRAWDLDDDGQYDDATGVTASRSFSAPGIFTVRLRVTDDDGASSTTSRTVTVADTPPPGGGANLVANPSFETDLSGWGSWQATRTRVQAADAPAGSYVARIARSSGTSFTIDDAPSVVPSSQAGGSYTARAMVRADASTSVGKRVTITLRERTPGGTIVRQTSASVVLTSTFQQVAVTAAPAAAGNDIDVRLGQASAVTGDAFAVDDVSVVRDP